MPEPFPVSLADRLRAAEERIAEYDLERVNLATAVDLAEREYVATLSRARNGDAAAREAVPDAALTFLRWSRETWASSARFEADRARVLADVAALRLELEARGR